MDPVTLAASVLTILSPYLAKAGEKVVDKMIDALPENAGKLWTALTEKFKGKLAAEEAVQDLANNPANEDTRTVFRIQLKKALTEDPEFLAALEVLVKKAEAESIKNSAVASGHGVAVNVGGSVRGNIVVGDHKTVNSPGKEK
jgi:predicted NACHT family NTPase